MILSELKLRLAGTFIQPKAGSEKLSARAGKLKNITVVLDSRDEVLLAKFSELRTVCGLDSKDLVVITCAEPEKEDPEDLNFSLADVSWTGRIRKQQLREFFERRHTVMVVFSRKTTSTLNFLLRNSSAELKIGRGENAAGLYDLEIFSRYEDADVFIDEVVKYLKILKFIV